MRTITVNTKRQRHVQAPVHVEAPVHVQLYSHFAQKYQPREYECFEPIQCQGPFFSVMINLDAWEGVETEDLCRIYIEGSPDQLAKECGFQITNILIEKAITQLLDSDQWRWINPGCSMLFIKKQVSPYYEES